METPSSTNSLKACLPVVALSRTLCIRATFGENRSPSLLSIANTLARSWRIEWSLYIFEEAGVVPSIASGCSPLSPNLVIPESFNPCRLENIFCSLSTCPVAGETDAEGMRITSEVGYRASWMASTKYSWSAAMTGSLLIMPHPLFVRCDKMRFRNCNGRGVALALGFVFVCSVGVARSCTQDTHPKT